MIRRLGNIAAIAAVILYLSSQKRDATAQDRLVALVEGLHWPHTGEDGAIRWMLSGAPIDEAEYETLCRERAGKVALHPAR